jgi:hypothetical protein
MRDYYVSPAGDDRNPGTRECPLASFEPLSSPDSPLLAGDTVHVRGGIIRSSGVVLRDVGDGPEAPVSIVADGSAVPVVDCAAGDSHGLTLEGCDGITIRGLAIRAAARDGVSITGRGAVTIEGVDVHGYARSGRGDGIHAAGSPDLLVRGSYLREGHRNAAPESRGLAVEGFSGRCRVLASEFYRNSGGGLDLTNDGAPDHAVLRRCVAHRNGFGSQGKRSADAPGFRIEGGAVIHRCIAYNNGGPGFISTGLTGTPAIVHATAWANAGAGYRRSDGAGDLINCLAVANGGGRIDRTRITRDGGGVVAAEGDVFRSTADTRPAFLQPHRDSRITDRGTDVGRPHGGDAPDPGARTAAGDAAPGEDDSRLATDSAILREWRRGWATDPGLRGSLLGDRSTQR